MPRKKSEKDVEFDVRLGARIEAARKAAKLTQPRLASAVGITKQQLYWYEVGRNSVPVLTLRKIALALACEVSVLIPKIT